MLNQRKTLIIIVAVFTLIAGGLFFTYKYITRVSVAPTGQESAGSGQVFPSSGLPGGTGSAPESAQTIPILRQVSSVPTAGGVTFDSDEDVFIRYVERATGHIFETRASSLDQTRISNTTIPRIQEALWSPDGASVILRYLDENELLKSFYGNITRDSGVLDGWFLSNNITSVSVHKDNSLFYLRQIGDSVEGYRSHFDGTNSTAVFTSTIYDWTPEWMKDSLTVTSKAANNVEGGMYRLRNGTLSKILSGSGLITKVSPDGASILFSVSNQDATALFVYTTKDKTTVQVPFRTLAEKCTWTTDTVFYCGSPYNLDRAAVYPDDWYTGRTSFSDDIWSYDTETNIGLLTYDAEADGRTFDITNLSTNQKGSLLLFINKNDLTLWALTLK